MAVRTRSFALDGGWVLDSWRWLWLFGRFGGDSDDIVDETSGVCFRWLVFMNNPFTVNDEFVFDRLPPGYLGCSFKTSWGFCEGY